MPGVRGDPEPLFGIGIVVHVHQTVRVHHAERQRRVGIAALRRRAVPLRGLVEVGFHPIALAVCLGEVELGVDVAVPGGRAHPLHGLCGITRDALPVAAHEPEQELRLGHPLLRGPAVPLRRLEGVLLHAVFAQAVDDPELDLRLGNAPPGEEADLRIGARPIAPLPAFSPVPAWFLLAGHGGGTTSGMREGRGIHSW